MTAEAVESCREAEVAEGTRRWAFCGALMLAVAGLLGLASVAVDPAPSDAQRRTIASFPKAKVVSPDGDDANPGTASQPWKTLTHASRAAVPGDVILIRKGTYTDQLGYVSTRGTKAKPIIFRNFPGERPTIVGTGRTHEQGGKVWGAIHLVQPAAHLVFQGLELKGTKDTIDTAGVQMWRVHNIVIRRNFIHDFGGGGINAAASEELRILANDVRRNGQRRPAATSGISLFEPVDFDKKSVGYTNVIAGNRVSHNKNVVPNHEGRITDGNCIILDLFKNTNYQGRTLITNNVCFANGGRGIHIFFSGNADVINNTLYHNRLSDDLQGTGELSTHGAFNVLFRNNLVWAAPGRENTNVITSRNVRFDHNLYVGARAATKGPGDRVIERPGFIKPGRGNNADFGLRAKSPAINAGFFNRSPDVDKSGRARLEEPDVGAVEFRTTG